MRYSLPYLCIASLNVSWISTFVTLGNRLFKSFPNQQQRLGRVKMLGYTKKEIKCVKKRNENVNPPQGENPCWLSFTVWVCEIWSVKKIQGNSAFFKYQLLNESYFKCLIILKLVIGVFHIKNTHFNFGKWYVKNIIWIRKFWFCSSEKWLNWCYIKLNTWITLYTDFF